MFHTTGWGGGYVLQNTLSVSIAGYHCFSQTIPYLIFSMLVWTIPGRSILNHILISLISYSVIYDSSYFFFSVFLIWYTSFPVLLPRPLGFKSGGSNRTLLRVLDLGTLVFLDGKTHCERCVLSDIQLAPIFGRTCTAASCCPSWLGDTNCRHSIPCS